MNGDGEHQCTWIGLTTNVNRISSNINIYLINPENSDLHLDPINRLTMDCATLSFSCQNGKVAFLDEEGKVTVWDYKQRLAVSWSIGNAFWGSRDTTMVGF